MITAPARLPVTLDDTRARIRQLEDDLTELEHGAPEADALIGELRVLRPHVATLRALAAR